MIYFVDTNTCIYFLNGKYESVKENFLSKRPNAIKISAIVKAELILGAYRSNRKKQTLEKVERFLKPFEVVDFTDEMSYTYAEIRSKLELAGKTISANDFLIAATTMYCNAVLVTNNTTEFTRVKGLKLENWVVE